MAGSVTRLACDETNGGSHPPYELGTGFSSFVADAIEIASIAGAGEVIPAMNEPPSPGGQMIALISRSA